MFDGKEIDDQIGVYRSESQRKRSRQMQSISGPGIKIPGTF